MSGPLATRDATESDFDAIELAVMETERGRWFLSEFARRNRHADTETLMTSLSRIERTINLQTEATELDRFRLNVLEMSRAIARTRAEIAAIKPPETGGRLLEASGELDSIVSATERATSDILAAAENVQEVAWTMREAGGDADACGRLDQHAVAIYTACSFQDLTAQRTRKVIEILGFLESRVNAMADIWHLETGEAAAPRDFASDGAAVAPSVMSQDDVDTVLVDRATDFHHGDAPVADPVAEGDAMDEAPVMPLDLSSEAALAELAADDSWEHAELHAAGGFEQDAAVAAALAEGDVEDEAPRGAAQADVTEGAVATPAQPVAEALPGIDDILFDTPPSAPLSAETKPHLHLVGAEPEAQRALAKAQGGHTLTPDEAAAALDALKNMSVEERTRLFS
jgi:chemotaxis protein CheZ